MVEISTEIGEINLNQTGAKVLGNLSIWSDGLLIISNAYRSSIVANQ